MAASEPRLMLEDDKTDGVKYRNRSSTLWSSIDSTAGRGSYIPDRPGDFTFKVYWWAIWWDISLP